MKKTIMYIILSLLLFVSCSDDHSSYTGLIIMGTLDQTFNSPVGYTVFNPPFYSSSKGIETAIQSDGRIIVMGYAYDGSKNDVLVLRYNKDGTLDNTFGLNGHVLYDGGGIDQKGLGMALLQDDAIVVTGYIRYDTNRDILVLKYTPDGVFDKVYTYSSEGEFTDIGFGLDIQADGKILVVGEESNGDNQDIILLRLNEDLEPDIGFGINGVVNYNGTGNENDKGFAVDVQNDGKIVVVGAHIPEGQEKEDVLVLRFNSDGTLDTNFGNFGIFTYLHTGDYSDYGNFVALQSDGKIVVAGAADDGQSFKILMLRLNASGTMDYGFGNNGVVIYQGQPSVFDYAFGVTVQQNGKILVVGASNNGANDDAIVLRYESSGLLDISFAENGVFTFNGMAEGEDRANGIAIQSDSKIVVTGYSHNGEDYYVLTFRLR